MLHLQLGLCENRNLYFKLKAALSVMSGDGRSGKVCVKDQLGYKQK